MGMTCTLCCATNDEIEQLIADPSAIGEFLDPENAATTRVQTVRPKGLLGLLLRLTPITITEAVPVDDAPLQPMDPDRQIDIEKGWHGLHFLFTGTADGGEEPACYLVRGGQDLDDDGHARALRPDQVRRFSDFLSDLTSAELARRYDPESMRKFDIYPDVIWTRPAAAEESPLEWLLECFADLQGFMARAAAADRGVIIHVG